MTVDLFNDFHLLSIVRKLISSTYNWPLLKALGYVFQTSAVSDEVCQDRYGVLDVKSFNRRSCTMCYYFLFHTERQFRPHADTMEYLESRNASNSRAIGLINPDIRNETAMKLVCSSLDEEECDRWRSCCTAAYDCCKEQVDRRKNMSQGCESTWDGYSCWEDTRPGNLVIKQCPSYVGYSVNPRSMSH